MKDGLKFNICGLDTSYLRNDDVEGLSKHIETKITGPLLYSCRFWAAHCRDTADAQDGRDTLLQQVRDFLHHRFLYWLEVMSLTKGVMTANIALLTAAPWIDVSCSSSVINYHAQGFCFRSWTKIYRPSREMLADLSSTSPFQFRKASHTSTCQHFHSLPPNP